jgi:SOS response regulatory protein OraA/RecX
MGLAQIYEQKFGADKAAAEKKAEGEQAAAEATADASTESAEAATSEEGKAEATDEEIDKALEGMSDEQLQELAKEVATDVKESQAKDKAENEKLADEYYAAGRIFAQGFMAETNGKVAAKAATTKQTPLQKFAGLLKAQMEKGAEKAPEKTTK